MQELDFAILNWIQENIRCDALDVIMPAITFLGNAGILWIAIALFMVVRKSTRKWGSMLCAGGALNGLIGNVLLKNLVARDRPCWINKDISMLVAIPKDYSFPSGHSMVSFMSATILMGYDKRIGIPAMILASLIAVSRLYLYVHFPTDVICGTLIGIILGLVVLLAGKKIYGETLFERGK